MFYSSRSIKINFFCRKLYEHAFLALEKDKPILSKLYILHKFGSKREKEISKYTYNELFVHIIENIQTQNANRIVQTKVELSDNERLRHLKHIIGLVQHRNIRSNISFRVPPVIMDKVKQIKDNTELDTLSEVCEIAIMNYITLIDETAYQLMLITLEAEFSKV